MDVANQRQPNRPPHFRRRSHAIPSTPTAGRGDPKALFYLDLASLRDRGATITHNAFIAIQHGPVIAKYPRRLISQLETLGIARQVSLWDGSNPVVLESCPPHFTFLDSDAMILASAVTTFFADASSRQASDYSHENPGWKRAWIESQRTGKATAVNMPCRTSRVLWLHGLCQRDQPIHCFRLRRSVPPRTR